MPTDQVASNGSKPKQNTLIFGAIVWTSVVLQSCYSMPLQKIGRTAFSSSSQCQIEARVNLICVLDIIQIDLKVMEGQARGLITLSLSLREKIPGKSGKIQSHL